MKKLVSVAMLIAVAVVVGFFPTKDENYSCENCNVVLIVADTLGAKHVGWYGYERDTSPFIDEFFGEDGLAFKHAYSTAPWTLPSFTSIWFSRLANTVVTKELEERESDLISILRENDIAVRGLFHRHADRAGFIFSYISAPFFENEIAYNEKPDISNFSKAAEEFNKLSEQYRKNDRPFFLLMHNFIVHDPHTPPEEYTSLFNQTSEFKKVQTEDINQAIDSGSVEEMREIFALRYDQEVRFLDDEIKLFIEAIPSDILNKTVFIFTSDHGEEFGEHGSFLHGTTLYNEVLHVPLFVRIPGVEAREFTYPVSLLDIAPTILNILGIEVPEKFEGINLFSNSQRNREITSIFGRLSTVPSDHGGRRDASPPPRLEELDAVDLEKEVVHSTGTSTIKWPIKTIHTDLGEEIYNLNTDPSEKVNLVQ